MRMVEILDREDTEGKWTAFNSHYLVFCETLVWFPNRSNYPRYRI